MVVKQSLGDNIEQDHTIGRILPLSESNSHLTTAVQCRTSMKTYSSNLVDSWRTFNIQFVMLYTCPSFGRLCLVLVILYIHHLIASLVNLTACRSKSTSMLDTERIIAIRVCVFTFLTYI